MAFNPDYVPDDVRIAKMRLYGILAICAVAFWGSVVYLWTTQLQINANIEMAKQKWETAYKIADADRKACKTF